MSKGKKGADGIERLDQLLARFEASSLEELSYEDADIEVTLRRGEAEPDWDGRGGASLPEEGGVVAPIAGEFCPNEALAEASGPLPAGQLLGSVLTPEGGIELRAIGGVRLSAVWPAGTRVAAGDLLFASEPDEA